MQGGKLIIRMGSEPNYDFGSKQMSRPQNRTISIYASKPFVHPGMAQSYEDLEFMRTNVLQGNEPWKTAFNDLKNRLLSTLFLVLLLLFLKMLMV